MNERHPLGQLIFSIQQARGWSERQLEERAAGKPGLGKSNISKIKNHPLVSIKGNVIKGLADLLGVSEQRVAKAALLSMGVDLGETSSTTLRQSVGSEPELTDKDRKILLAVLNAMEEEVVGNVEYPAPIGAHPGYQNEHDLAADSEPNRGKEIDERYQVLGEESQELPD